MIIACEYRKDIDGDLIYKLNCRIQIIDGSSEYVLVWKGIFNSDNTLLACCDDEGHLLGRGISESNSTSWSLLKKAGIDFLVTELGEVIKL